MSKNSRWLLALTCLAIAGCPTPEVADGGTDAPSNDSPSMTDGGTDAPAVEDAPADAPVELDAPAQPDAPETDGGVPLPAIVTPAPHLVPASADGHDRYYGVTFAPDSSFYVVGVRAAGVATTDDFSTLVAHFGADGELDTTFGEDGFFVTNLTVGANGELARGIALTSDGHIIVAATVDAVGAADARDRDAAVLRLLPNGTLDTTFGVDGVRIVDLSTGEIDGTAFTADSAYGLAVDADDRIVVSGSRKRDDATDSDFVVFRLTADGALDTTFDTDGIFSLDISEVNASARGVTILPSGRILAEGYYNLSGSVRPVIYALDEDGALDAGFGTDGIYTEVVLTAQTEVYDIALVGEQIVTTGYGRELAPDDNDVISLRLSSAGVRDLTYGTDGAAVVTGFDFADTSRSLVALPDGRTLHVGSSRTSATEGDASIIVLTTSGAPDTAFDTDGVSLLNFAAGTADTFWSVDLDPRGERVVVVGIGGTTPATDDDGLVYLLPVP